MSVEAESAVTVMFLHIRRVLNVCPSACSHHSQIIRNLLGELAEKNLRLNEKLTHMGQRTTRAKLLSYFSGEAQRRGGYEFDIPFSRQQLADYLGVERSGLSLELGKSGMRACSTFIKATFFSRRQRRMVFLLLRVKNLPFKPPLAYWKVRIHRAECWAFTEGERNYEPAEIDKVASARTI